jgi:hypothetical protein
MPWVQGKMMSEKICGYMNQVGYMEVKRSKSVDGACTVRSDFNETEDWYAKDQFNAFENGRFIDPTIPKLMAAVEAARGHGTGQVRQPPPRRAAARRREGAPKVAKIKYNVKGVERGGGNYVQPTPGLYEMEIKEANHRDADGKNDIELVLEITKNNEEFAGSRVWTYVGLGEASQWKLAELTDALGLPESGTLDTATSC